jgi:vesicle-associated membrane protein 4
MENVDETRQINDTINATIKVVQENLNKLSQRGDHLHSLQDTTGNLAESAAGFRRGTNQVRKQMWLKNMRMRLYLVAGVVIIVMLLAGGISWIVRR